MKDEYKSLPYRDNISCIVFKNGRYLLVQLVLWESDWWKFPQGGIHEGESLAEAAKRELKEELGTEEFDFVATSKNTLQYDWDNLSIERAKKQWRGQNQKYLLAQYNGSDEQICPQEGEISTYKWVKKRQLKKYLDHNFPPFQGYWGAIEKVLLEFNDILQ